MRRKSIEGLMKSVVGLHLNKLDIIIGFHIILIVVFTD